jgi:Arc/MetJ-type ribon-helix-helix transcriptional regulator
MAKVIPVRFDDETVRWIDEQCAERGVNRSDFLRKCVSRVKVGTQTKGQT